MVRTAFSLCAIWLLFPLVSFNQTFIVDISSSLDESAYSAYELPGGGYFICCARGEYDPMVPNFYYNDIIFKFDVSGNIVDSTILDESGFYYIASLHLMSYQQNTFFWSQIRDKSNVDHPGLLYGYISDDLEVRVENIVFNADTGWAFYDCIVNNAGNLVFLGTEGIFETGSFYNVVLELNSNNIIVRKGILGANYYQKIVELPVIQAYHLGGADTICQVDYDLNYDGIVFAKPLNDTLFFYTGMISISDSTYARSAVGMEYPPHFDLDFGYAVFNQYGNRLSLATFGKPDTTDWSYLVDCHSADSIFIGGISNYISGLFVNNDSWLAVYNINQTDGIYWNYYLGGNGLYSLSGILATSDGGCLMTGTYWDWRNNPNQERDAVIVKVNAEGLLVNADDGRVPMLSRFLVYPNPGSEKLYLECGLSDGIFEMFDNYGQIVVSKRFLSGYLVLNTTELANGLYYYRIISGKKAYFTGKWIKE